MACFGATDAREAVMQQLRGALEGGGVDNADTQAACNAIWVRALGGFFGLHVQTPHSGGLFTLSMHTACSPAPGKPLQRTTALVGCIWLCWSQEFCSIPPKRVINSLFIRASPPRAPCPCARGAISVNDAGHPSAKCACLHTSKAKPSKTEPRCCSARST